MLRSWAVVGTMMALAGACGCSSSSSHAGSSPGASGAGGGGAGGAGGAGAGGANGNAVYSKLDDPSKWSFYFPIAADAYGYIGGAFDGKYAYFAPASDQADATRYDTTAPFKSASPWSSYDIQANASEPDAAEFQGAAFDGRYVYMVSAFGGGDPDQPVIARYDTHAGFGKPAAWVTYSLAGMPDVPDVASGAVFDGHYVYILGEGGSGIARYDPAKPFETWTSWVTFDVANVDPALRDAAGDENGFAGAVFDGRYLDVVPAGDRDGHIRAVRCDTQAKFASASSWTKFDLTANVASSLQAFAGGVFDGRYVYFVPSGSLAVRFDTQAPFAKASSWAVFDTTMVKAQAKDFLNGAFDGRYVYYVPSTVAQQDIHALVTRFDTQKSFISSSSWSTFDLTSAYNGGKSLIGFGGAVFDGRYLYLMPITALYGKGPSVFARFDAKQPPSLPPGPAHGSFF